MGKPKVILITGVLGFIFSNFIRKIVDKFPEYRFVGIDKAVKSYNLNNMFEHSNYKFYFADIADSHIIDNIFTIEQPDIIISGAAESFVDDSISDIMPFLHTNIIGTQTLVNISLKHNVKKFIHVSTDEVLGQKLNKEDQAWDEKALLQPRNPYSCSKAGAEHIIMSAHYTHGLQYNITRSCNIFGPRQKPQNLIPHIITSLLHDKEIQIHGSGSNFRQYCFVDDKISAIMKIIIYGEINQVYNIGNDNYFSNIEMVEYISKLMNKKPKIKFIEDRKSHDFGYKVSYEKLKKLNWKPNNDIDKNMKLTINWYNEIDRFKK